MSNLCISSLVVRTKPAMLASVGDRIDAMEEAEVYGKHEDGRLVVVLDTANNRQAAQTITAIQKQADILSATLIYQYDDQFGTQVEAPVWASHGVILSKQMQQQQQQRQQVSAFLLSNPPLQQAKTMSVGTRRPVDSAGSVAACW